MRLLYWKASEGNFGDDLNPWLWSRLIPTVVGSGDGAFIGIGSILDRDILSGQVEENEKVVVFGSGARSPEAAPSIGPGWDVRFVRGPLTAGAVGGVPYITDPAICVRFIDFPAEPKRHAVSLILHIHSLRARSYWRSVCQLIGINLIDPSMPVETVLSEIRSSNLVLADAMHGAIVSDALRVPWIRVRTRHAWDEGDGVNDFKWQDWMQSLEIKCDVVELPILPAAQGFGWRVKNAAKSILAAIKLRATSCQAGCLSSEKILEQKTQAIAAELEYVRSKYSA